MALAPKMDLPPTLDLPIPKLITREYILEPELSNVIKPELFKLGSTAEYYKTAVTEIVQDTIKDAEKKVEENVLPAVEDFKNDVIDKVEDKLQDLKSVAIKDLTAMHQKITDELKVRVPEEIGKLKNKFCCFV